MVDVDAIICYQACGRGGQEYVTGSILGIEDVALGTGTVVPPLSVLTAMATDRVGGATLIYV